MGQSLRLRADRGIRRRRPPDAGAAASSDAQPNERTFLTRLNTTLAESARPSTPGLAADSSLEWAASHVKECEFQDKKMVAKYIEANLQGLLLEHEHSSAAVQDATQKEEARMTKSFKDRLSQQARTAKRTGSQAPTMQDLQRARLFVGPDVSLPMHSWLSSLARREARVVVQPHNANVWVSKNPWEPDLRIHLAAVLAGGWVVTPSVITADTGQNLLKADFWYL